MSEILTDQLVTYLQQFLYAPKTLQVTILCLPINKSQEKKLLEQHQKTKKKGGKGVTEKQNQRNKKGVLSDPELFFSRLESHCLLSLQLTIAGSKTSVEAPMRYLCVRFWHELHSMHRTCLRAKKFAPCTHLSHF
ncbi:hypothetical protein OIU77_002923 [Salix suchowensis]|uniref:Uncharacterized protein n=1 Tax=Salix suchowensis TaxID=1278906 RepID=A0ABQ9AXX1_9ROSI|nr:hypothetical protein OIU77_002923 [Salix suchowensis]